MKRTMTALILITVFIFSVVVFDLWFMTDFADEMNRRIELVERSMDSDSRKRAALELDEYFTKKSFLAHRLVPTGRLDDLDMLLHKLNAYIQTDDEHEVLATIAEIRSKINSMYSTSLYRWYHPEEFRIE